MTEVALFWLVVGGVSAILFFGIAAVVTVRGIGELRELLGHGEKRRGPEG
jgi:hypothetical protein